MSEGQAPRRLLEDPAADAELKSLLLLARRDQPSEDQLARLASRLSPLVGVPPELLHGPPPASSVPPSAPLTGPAAGSTTAAKLVWAKLSGATLSKWNSAALVAGAGSWYWAAGHEPVVPSPRPVAPWAAPSSDVGSPAPGRDETIASPRAIAPARGHPSGTRDQGAGQREPAGLDESGAVSASGGMSPPRERRSMRSAAQANGAASQPAADGDVAVPQAAPGAGASPKVRVRAPRARGVAAPVAELQLIRQAQAQRGRHRRVLASAQRHAVLYPRGALVQEREVLAIEALFGLGRRTEGRARLDAFEQRYPGSAHLPQLHRLRADHTPD